MKINSKVTLLILLSFQLSFSQQMPIDFSDNADNFIAFNGSGFSFNVNPEDTNDTVGQFFNDGNEVWQGFYIDLIAPIDLDQQQQISLSFYQFDPNTHNIYLKLENGTNPDVEVVQNTSGSGWTDGLVFDFSNATISGTANTVSATGTYTRLVIFIDGGVSSAGTYLIDDIDDGTEPVDPNELDVIYTDLVWSDEFDSTTPVPVDPAKWHYQTLGPNGGQWFNGEEQHYTNRPDNSFVENGFLNIIAKSETFTQNGVELPYTSARLNSKFAFTYGRVDVRARLPFGDGTWPAIWTLGKNVNEVGAYWQTQGFGTTTWPACGEIDIMEHGLGAVNHVSSALHTPCAGCSGNTMNTQSFILPDVANNFHVYSMNWSPNQITFLIDGVGFYTYNPAVKDDSTWPFYLDQYLILNVAMGGFAGTIDSSFDQSSMVIDYVRVYQNNLSVDDTFAEQFKVFPNPAHATITIASQANIDAIKIYDVLGKLIQSKTENVTQVNVSNFESGMYVIQIHSGNRVVTKKLIVN
nr:family 16 glycosylhydrolase [uncultured Psychroserpens sp.]